jgi:hypothetical protein
VFTPLVGGTSKEDIKSGRVAALSYRRVAAAHDLHQGGDDLDGVRLHPARHAVDGARSR